MPADTSSLILPFNDHLKSKKFTAPDCTGLKTKWTSTLETTKQFPVNSGTVVEVTCTEADAINEGSSEVTCITGTHFIFSKEPTCAIPGL